MNINRNNYEEFFVLYIDNELKASERAAVELFLSENPDLKTELDMLQQAVLPMDEPVGFFNKELLFRSEANDAATDPSNLSKSSTPVINELNCEAYFVMYGDNELSNDDNALVEDFIYRHPQYQEHFELIQQVKFQPEKNIIFPDKSVLYRSEKDRKVVPLFPAMRAWKMAAAAAVMLMIGGSAWYAMKTGENDGVSGGVAGVIEDTNSTQPAKSIQQPGITENAKSSADLAAVEPVHADKTSASAKKQIALKSVAGQPEQNTNKQFADAGTKKVSKDRNILNGSDVTQERNNVKIENEKIKVPVVEEKITDQSLASLDPKKTPDTKVAIGPVELPENNVFAKMANDNDEEFATSDKKNRARGFFRKVSRVFDKATSKEPSENRKGLHIASFAINLK